MHELVPIAAGTPQVLRDDPLLQGLDTPNRFAFVLYLVWSFLPLLLAGVGVVLAFGWVVTPLGVSAAVGCAVLALLNASAAVYLAARRPSGIALAEWAVVGGIVATQAPVVVRVARPWEEPGTGEGSPMAVMMGVIFFGGLLGALCTLPGVIIAGWLWTSAQIRVPRHGPPSDTSQTRG